MDIERALVGRAIHTGQVDVVMQDGISAEHFDDQQVSRVWEWATGYVRTYNVSPTLEAAQRKFPEFEFVLVADPIQYLSDQTKMLAKKRLVIDALHQVARAAEDQEQIGHLDELLLQAARRVAIEGPSLRVDTYNDMAQRIDEYYDAQGMPLGIKCGIPTFDKEIVGFQPGEFITIAGPLGFGKSAIAQHMALEAYRQGKTVLIISLEMTAKGVLGRLDTMTTHFPHRELRMRTLSEQDVEKWRAAAEDVKTKPNNIYMADHVGVCTIDTVYSLITRYQPDLAIIDYISLMQSPLGGWQAIDWKDLTALTRELKLLAKNLGVALVGVAQTTRAGLKEGATLDNIAYAMSVAQDSDIVIGLNQTPEMKSNSRLEVKLMKNREGSLAEVQLHWDPSTWDIREWSVSDAFGAPGGKATSASVDAAQDG